MPQAAAHILIPLLLAAIYRDYIAKKKFSLHYVLIAGLGGIIPDLDVLAFWVLYFFGFTFWQIHKTLLHSFLIPIILLLMFLLFRKTNLLKLKKYGLKLNMIFLALAFGTLIHLILDAIFGELIIPFWPLLNLRIGINFVNYLPNALQDLAMPSLDAALLIIWLIYTQIKHKIADFV